MGESEWRTMDSAPKDGTDVLVARRDDEGEMWCAVAQWWVAAWAFAYGRPPAMTLLAFEPTHWHPLPPPPTKDTK